MKPFEFEAVTVAEAKRVLDGRPRAVAPDGSARRVTRDEKETLQASTMQWLDELPVNAQPLSLARSYPRIANRICGLWDKPVRCSSYLVDLLIVRRVNRQGFPLAIANEISELTAYYASLHPVERPWVEAR